MAREELSIQKKITGPIQSYLFSLGIGDVFPSSTSSAGQRSQPWCRSRGPRLFRTGFATFWSRSRNKLWLKGESSGHRLVVKEISTDCDLDTVLVKVEALGPGVCHEGYQSCFFRKLDGGEWQISEAKTYDPNAVYGN